MTRRRQAVEAPPPPFVLLKAYSFGPPEPCVAALEVGDGYLCLEHLVGLGYLTVFSVKKAELGGLQYKRTDLDAGQRLAELKAKALISGATLEAIQLLGALMPLKREEELQMAEAGTKLSRKGADKEGLKAAAKTAPVGGKKEPKAPKTEGGRKGNPDALAKARAARAENTGPDKRKIAVKEELKKGNPFRDETGRSAAFEKMKRAKTVQDYLDAGGPAKYVKKFADMGHITVS